LRETLWKKCKKFARNLFLCKVHKKEAVNSAKVLRTEKKESLAILWKMVYNVRA
jgi:hypothetical protein